MRGGRLCATGTYLQAGQLTDVSALLQDADSLTPEQIEFKQVSENQMSPEQLEDLKFAWR